MYMRMKNIQRVCLGLIASVSAMIFSPPLTAATRPNVVVILSDDQGWGDLSLNGNTNLSTPNIDKLAADGARFDRFYVCPVCSPTRAEFLTGRYHVRSHVYSTSAGGERMDLEDVTIADTFKAAGYATAAFGKWHNGMQYPYHPNGRGFDEYYGFCSGHWGDYFSPQLEQNGKLVQGDGFVTDDFTNKAIQFIEQHKDQPFFVYLPINTPHSPMQVPDRWWNKFKDKDLTMRDRNPKKEKQGHTRAALAMCENIDWNVGRISKKLDELNLTENTLVIYFCDNGPNGFRWNGGMKGRKGSTDEGGVRSPMVMRWPAQIKPGTRVRKNGAVIDLLPTLAEMTGIPIISKKPLDGVSLKPLLLENDSDWKNRLIFSHWNKRVSVRNDNYMLDNDGRLFNLKTDPGQKTDISTDHPDAAKKLRLAVTDWRQNVLKGYNIDNRPFLIGHESYKYTQIPARDGTAHGKIKRSNRFPNCSYFTNWVSVDDEITWQAEVAATGKYQVELAYACPAADVGSKIQLSFNDSQVQGEIITAHEPALVGEGNDRFPRIESYVKNFRMINLGELDLKKGSGTLRLKALTKPGQSVMEFRLLLLTRID
jgi:arylsulfatase A-like enzyme